MSFFIVKPFITAILSGMVLAYIFKPIYNCISKKIKNKNISAFIVTILIILIILVPVSLIINTVSRESYSLYISSKQNVKQIIDTFSENCPVEGNGIKCTINNFIKGIITDSKNRYYLDSSIEKGATFLTETVSGFIISIPSKILSVFIIFFVAFFLIRDWDKLAYKVERLLPLKEKHKKEIFKKFNDTTFAVIYGSIIIASIQGLLGSIGFYAAGISSPIIWGILMMFFALVPFIGTPIIWVPASLYLMFTGYLESDTFTIVKGVLLLLYGAFVISTIDNFLKPKIIGDRAKIHPVVVLLGVFGGIKIFGFIGLLVGPVLLALFIAFIKIYEEENIF